VIGIVVAALAVIGVVAFFLLRDDDDGTIAGPDPDDTTEVTTEVTTPSTPSTPADGTDPEPVIPDVTLPDVTLPTFPDFSLPTLPDFSIPDLSIPESPGTFAPPGSIPESTEPPEGLGDDAQLDDLAQECFDGSMQACDDLYDDAEPGSAYRRYGDTCAGRQPAGTRQYCVASFPE
jgi:hypothetical protein